MATVHTLGLHRGQSQVFRDQRRFRVVCAGRRWGKTRLAIVEMLRRVPSLTPAADQEALIWYVAPTRKEAKRILWRALKRSVPEGWLRAKPNESDLLLEFVNGVILQLHGSDQDPDSLRGSGVKFVVPDENATMKPEVWTEVLWPSLVDTHGEALILGTPKSYNHFHDYFAQGQSVDPIWANWGSYQFRTIDSPFIDPAEVEQFKATNDERTYRQEFEASFEAMSGRAYYAFDRQFNVQPVTLNPGLPIAYSQDFNINPNCAVIGQVVGDAVYVWREIKSRHAGGEATRATARKALELLRSLHPRAGVRVYGDPSGSSGKTTGPADHAVVREVLGPLGVTWRIPSGAPHVRDRVSAVNGRACSMTGARRLFVDPTCVGLIADLEQVVFDDGGDLDKDNPELTHLSDALGYWVAREFPILPDTFGTDHFGRLEA